MNKLTVVPSKFNPKSTYTSAKTLTDEEVTQHIEKHKTDLRWSGEYRYMGWVWNFRPYLKKFLVLKYDNWQVCWFVSLEVAKKTIEKEMLCEDDDECDLYYEIYEIPNEPKPENLPFGY